MNIIHKSGGTGKRTDAHLKTAIDDILHIPPMDQRELDRVMRAIGADRDRPTNEPNPIPKPGMVLAMRSTQRRLRGALMTLYQARLDRLICLLIGSAGLAIGFMALLGPNLLSEARLLALTTMLAGVGLVAHTIQSGRSGFLEAIHSIRLNSVTEWAGMRVVRGHSQVHEAEAHLAAAARKNRSERLMSVDIWTRPRSSCNTQGFDHFQRELDAYVDELGEDGALSVASACTKENIDQVAAKMLGRLGRAHQRFFHGNPLQFDVLISDDEALLSFPRQGNDRDFAIHFRDPSVVQDLWSVMRAQLEEKVYVASHEVESEADIEEIVQHVYDGGGVELHPVPRSL